jgi:two-component system sensor histidine kinase UhpB
VEPWSSLPLYWRVSLINSAVFLVGAIVLVVSPATVSAEVSATELGVLASGLVLIMGLNAALLRSSLAPVDHLIALMQRLDLERPGSRLTEPSNGSVRRLVSNFNAMVSRLELDRARSNAKALAAQEAERHRIAQELHDEIGQSLTVVLLGLSRVAESAPPGISEELQVLQETARTSLEEVREVARRLRPGVLEDLGLFSALTALAAEFSSHTGGLVRRDIASGLPKLTSEAELVIYRITQEALTNAARHAEADNVDLSLTPYGSGVELRVRDNGAGMAGQLEGAGIRGMRERALLIGAELTVSSGPHGGTEVRLNIPTATAAGTHESRQ